MAKNPDPLKVLKKTEKVLILCLNDAHKQKKQTGKCPGQEKTGQLARLLNSYTRLMALVADKEPDLDYGDPKYIEELHGSH
jgi:hypothetical protein